MSTRSQHSRRGIGFNRSQREKEARRLMLQGAHESGTGTRRPFSDLSRSFDALNLTNSSPLALSPHRSGVDEGDDSDELENIDHKPSAGIENHPPSTNQDDDPPKGAQSASKLNLCSHIQLTVTRPTLDVEPRRKCPWPVPHIIVDYQGVKYAWGRTTLQKVGAKVNQCKCQYIAIPWLTTQVLSAIFSGRKGIVRQVILSVCWTPPTVAWPI